MARNFLLTGFGAFLDVKDNPSGSLATALDGRILRCKRGNVQICSKILDVKYETVAAETLLAARQINAIGILGMGVARSATAPRVERTGKAQCDGVTLDAAGQSRGLLGDVPILQSVYSEALAAALGISLSDDAGAYVCNAWLYGVLAGLQAAGGPERPVAFLHVPSTGMDPELLAAGLTTWISGL